jgi:hypothetical protein
MKSTFKKTTIKSFILVIFIGSLYSCGSSTEPVPVPVLACKLLSSVTTNSNSTTTQTYVYEGEFLKKRTYELSGAGAANTSNTTIYTLNTEGFATSSSYTSSSSATPTISNYTYANGKMLAQGDIYTYQYDGSGNFIKYTLGLTTTKSYANGILTGIVGSSSVYTIESGRIIKNIASATSTFIYSYDSEGRMSEMQWFINNALNQRIVYEYLPNPFKNATPILKGTPTIPNDYGKQGFYSKVTTFNASGAKISENVYTYTFNSKGYPTNLSYTSTGTNNNGTGNTIYTYQDCQ